MEYQKIISLLDNTPNQSSKFRAKNWVAINDHSRRTYSADSQIKLKTMMLNSSLYDYSDAYILVKGTITVPDTVVASAAANTNREVTLKNCVPFTDCISEVNNTKVDNAKDIDVVMPMHNLMKCINNYLKAFGSLWHYFRDEPDVNGNGAIVDFNETNPTKSLNPKAKIASQARANVRIDIEIMVPLKQLNNFRRTPKIPLIICEINLILIWSQDCVIVSTPNTDQGATFSIADTNLCVPVVTLSSEDNAKPLKQLKSGFKRPINWNKYKSKVPIERATQYLDYLIGPSFQGEKRRFVLSFKNNVQWTHYDRYFLPTVEIKDYNVMIDGQKFFDQPVKKEHMIIFERLHLVKEMITQLVVY